LPRTQPNAGEGEFARLIDGGRRGDPACLRALHDRVVRLVAAYLRSNGAVDHAGSTNEVLFRALTNLDRFEGGEDRYRSWVLTIAHHLMIDERRARSRRPAEVPFVDEHDQRSAPDDPAEAAELSAGTRAVLAAVAGLPEAQRQVITLRWVGGLSLAEVAEILGCRVGAVKALQHRGVEALRGRLVSQPVDLTFTAT
jgi:RNA polymerase sigma-70 factor (ECF subfamily)